MMHLKNYLRGLSVIDEKEKSLILKDQTILTPSTLWFEENNKKTFNIMFGGLE